MALLTAFIVCSCGSDSDSDKEKDSVVIQITSRETTESTTKSVKIKEEVIEKATRGSNAEATEPTDKSSKSSSTSSKSKKKSSKFPTQGQTQPNTYVTVTTAPAGSFSKGDLEFVYDGAYIDLDDEIDDALAILGDDNSVTELSKTKTEYEYDNLTLQTYTANDKEKVEQITITSDKIPTKKNAAVGMYATKLRTVYGDPSKKTDTAYTYTSGNKSLVFNYENNIVTSYSYVLNH